MTESTLPPSDMDGDNEQQNVVLPVPEADKPAEATTPAEARNRVTQASAMELAPETLLGSWFLRLDGGTVKVQGLIVAEPVPQRIYLAAIRSGLDGTGQRKDGTDLTRAQILLRVEELTGADDGHETRFFDSEDAMQAAYVQLETEAREEGV